MNGLKRGEFFRSDSARHLVNATASPTTAHMKGILRYFFFILHSWPSFALFAYTGALLWAVTLLSTGYVLGEEWACAATHAGCYPYLFGGICLAVALIGWLMHRRFGILSFILVFGKRRNTVL